MNFATASKEEFIGALTEWKTAGNALAELKSRFLVANATAFSSSVAKTADQRKADAELATSDLRLELDRAEVTERAAYHLVIFLRGPAFGERG